MAHIRKLPPDARGRERPRPWQARQELPRDPLDPDARPQASATFATKREASATVARWDAWAAAGAWDAIVADTRVGKAAAAAARAAAARAAQERDAAEDQARARGEGPPADPARWTVADLLHQWLDDHVAPRVRPRTLYLYREAVERTLIPVLGDTPLSGLTPPRIQAAYTRLRAAGVSDRALAQAHQRLNQALAMAERQDIISRNPAARVTRPTYRPRERASWTEEQARRVLAAALAPGASSYGPVWAITLTTGLRRGELLGLRWRDVDLAAGLLRVRVARKKGGGAHPEKLVEGELKTAKGRRELGLSPAMVAALRAHKVAQAEARLRGAAAARYGRGGGYQDNDLVFASAVGTPPEPSNLRRDYLRLIERAGVPVIAIHDARHTFASIAIAAGEPLKAVSEALGHADPAITIRTYAHVSAAQRAGVSARMGDRLMREGAEVAGEEIQNAPGDAMGGADRGR